MAITAADVAVWAELKRLGVIPPSPAVVEIGQANWYGDIEPPAHLCPPPGLPLAEEAFAIARAFWDETFPVRPGGVCYHRAIDLHGQPGAIKHDLNAAIPAAWHSMFNVLVNTGTAEHVFNQHAFWQNCHDLTAPGGLMVHGLPWTGWVNHGLYNYQPGFVLDLAEANGYEVLLFWCTTIEPLTVRPVFKTDGDNQLVLSPQESTMLHVALRKHARAPFRTPWQSVYSPAADPAGWQSVEGWLTPCEGKALQELARDKRALELGAWKGRSTCCLAEVARNVTTIDTFQGDESTGRADTYKEWSDNLHARGHTPKTTAIQCGFADAMAAVCRPAFALAFVDGDHGADGTEEACRLALRCVEPGGTVALHDWHMASVREGAARCGLVTPAGAAGGLAWFTIGEGGK